MFHAHHLVTYSGASRSSFPIILLLRQLAYLVLGWVIMLSAMMSPTLIESIQHVAERSFKRQRGRAIGLFIIGYVTVWIVTNSAILLIMLSISLLELPSHHLIIGVSIIAFLWQCSPIKQRSLNRAHNHRELAAFGLAADLDTLYFGITHGSWCISSCWALMLFPMVLPQGHVAAMATMTFLIVSERLEAPKTPTWHLRFPGKLIQISIAQTQILFSSQLLKQE